MFSRLMSRKRTATRFRLPYTAKQVYAMLYAACQVEVVNRHREFVVTDEYKKHLWDISQWLTSKDSTFGLFLCGGAGNGKTTILRALQISQTTCVAMSHIPVGRMIIPHVAIPSSLRKTLYCLPRHTTIPLVRTRVRCTGTKKYAALRYWRLMTLGKNPRRAFTMETSLRRLWILSPFVMRNNSALWCHPTFLLPRLPLITMNVLLTASVK